MRGLEARWGCTGLPDLDLELQGAMSGLMLTLDILSPLLGPGWSPGHFPVVSFPSAAAARELSRLVRCLSLLCP